MSARARRLPARAIFARAEKIGEQLGVPLALARTGAGYVLVSAPLALVEADALLTRLEIACEESHELIYGEKVRTAAAEPEQGGAP